MTRTLRATALLTSLLLTCWASESNALSGTISAQDLIKFLKDYQNSGNQHRESLAADLQRRLAEAGITFNDNGFLVSGVVPPNSSTVFSCNDLKAFPFGTTTLLSGSTLMGGFVGPTSIDVDGGSWSASLDGSATSFTYSVNRGNLGFGVNLGGSIDAHANGVLHWSAGFYRPEIKCSSIGWPCWPEIHWRCNTLGGEGFNASVAGRFSAQAALTLDATLEPGSNGRYQIVLGRQVLNSGADPLSGSADVAVRASVLTDLVVHTLLVNLALSQPVGQAAVSQQINNKVNDRISDFNPRIREQLPVVYELPDVDPSVRRLVAEIIDSPALHRFVEQHFQQILFYLLVNDRDALVQFVTSSAACEATRLARANMQLPALFSNATGSCIAADPDGGDQGSYFTDASCTRQVAFRPTPYNDFCTEILSGTPNLRLGNAALWSPDFNQPNDPRPSLASKKWTLPHGPRMAITTESISGNTVPFMKRVRYRDVATLRPSSNVTPLYWYCLNVNEANDCTKWSFQTGFAPSSPGDVHLLGYIKTLQETGTAPVYWHCTSTNMDNDCIRPLAILGGTSDTLIGYVKTVQPPGTVPLYSNCVVANSDGDCQKWALGTSASSIGGGLLGYIDANPVTSRGNCALEMRVYKKDPHATGLTPLLALHGGSWQFRGGAFLGFEATISHYTEQDFVVFAPFYRLANTLDGNTECNGAALEEIVQDAEAALEWVKVHGVAFGAKADKPALMGQSAGGHLAGWLMTHRPGDVAGGLLLYAPTDMLDILTHARPGGAYEAFAGSIDILSNAFGSDVRSIDLANPPEFVRQNSYHQLVAQGGASIPPAFLIHGRADSLVPSNQSVLMCNAYGGNAINSGAGLRATYACGTHGAQLHVFEQSEHALDACLTTDVAGLCFAGDGQTRDLVVDSLRQAREWLQGSVNLPPSVNPGSNQSVIRGALVTLSGTATDPDGSIVSYSWLQTAGPAVALANSSTATATFTAPYVSTTTYLDFRLTATDNRGATASAPVTVTVTIPPPTSSTCPLCKLQ